MTGKFLLDEALYSYFLSIDVVLVTSLKVQVAVNQEMCTLEVKALTSLRRIVGLDQEDTEDLEVEVAATSHEVHQEVAAVVGEGVQVVVEVVASHQEAEEVAAVAPESLTWVRLLTSSCW